MRKILLTLAVVCCFGVFSAVAQNSNTTSPNEQQRTYTQSTTTTTEHNSTNSEDNYNQRNGSSATQQAGTMNNSEQSGALTKSESATTPNTPADSQGKQTIEGCLVKDQSGYFIQSLKGERTQVSGSPDLQSHVGERVRVEGSPSSEGNNTAGTNQTWNSKQNGQAVSGQSNSTTNSNSMSHNTAGDANSLFLVTRVDTISTRCPLNPNSRSPRGQSSNPY